MKVNTSEDAGDFFVGVLEFKDATTGMRVYNALTVKK